MSRENNNLREWIYDLMWGAIELQELRLPNGESVKSEFEEKMPCEQKYQQMLDAYARLCERLGCPGQEDRDVEEIISSLLYIQRRLAYNMYDYGAAFTRMEIEEKHKKKGSTSSK